MNANANNDKEQKHTNFAFERIVGQLQHLRNGNALVQRANEDLKLSQRTHAFVTHHSNPDAVHERERSARKFTS